MSIRITAVAQTTIAAMAEVEGVSQGLVIRAMLAEASQHRVAVVTRIRAMRGEV